MSDKTLIFIHIPKTAGTTMRGIMFNQYGADKVCGIYDMNENFTHNEDFNAFEEKDKRSYIAIIGHFSYGIHEILAKGQEYFYATTLRDPVRRVLSLYNSTVKRQFKNIEAPPIEDLLNKFHNPWYDNEQVRMLSGVKARFGECTEEMLESAKSNLNACPFFGITEAFEESYFLGSKTMGWKPIGYNSKNTKSYPQNMKSETVSEEILALIKKNNALDIRLYDYARDLFQERLKAVGEDWKSQLEEFKIELESCNSSDEMSLLEDRILKLEEELCQSEGLLRKKIMKDLHRYHCNYYLEAKRCGFKKKVLVKSLKKALKVYPFYYKNIKVLYHMLFV